MHMLFVLQCFLLSMLGHCCFTEFIWDTLQTVSIEESSNHFPGLISAVLLWLTNTVSLVQPHTHKIIPTLLLPANCAHRTDILLSTHSLMTLLYCYLWPIINNVQLKRYLRVKGNEKWVGPLSNSFISFFCSCQIKSFERMMPFFFFFFLNLSLFCMTNGVQRVSMVASHEVCVKLM